MATEIIKVANVKCQGCVATIERALGELPGISEVQVEQSSGIVKIQGDPLSRQQLCEKLTELGYPEQPD